MPSFNKLMNLVISQLIIQYFVATSLAFADILLGMVVVPFSLVQVRNIELVATSDNTFLCQEVLGQWIFGYYWCQVRLLQE